MRSTGRTSPAFGCGPAAAIDQSLGSGWGSTTGPDDVITTPTTPKSVTVALPRAIDISELSVDPGNTCGDAGSASTKGYRRGNIDRRHEFCGRRGG